MAKNLDGIKKLNPEEIKKNRKIVLNYIEEKDKELESIKEPKTTSRIASVFNNVDGVKLNRIFSTKPKVNNLPEKPATGRNNFDLANKREVSGKEKNRRDKIEREELAKKEIAEKARREAEEKAKFEESRRWQEKLRLEEKKREEKLKAEENRRLELEKERAKQIKIEREKFIKKEIAEKAKHKAEEKAKAEEIRKKLKEEELAKKEIAEKARRDVEEKAKAEKARKLREKLRLEEKKREEKRIMKENERLEKIKRAEEVKRIKQEIKLAKMAEAAKRKIKRQKALRFFKKNLNNKLSEIISATKQNLVYGILYIFVFLIIGYVIFCLLALRSKIDDNVIGEMRRFIPVPAVITSQGIINYNDFSNIKNDNYINSNLSERKNILIKWVVLKNLTKKYGLPADLSSQSLALAFAADKDYNQVGLSRINKINQLLKNIDDIEQLSKYADEYSDVIYYDSEGAAEKFGTAAFNLNANQISGIIFSNNGYYIAQIIDNKNGRLGIKYLFIAAKTLDQYISEKLTKTKIFILAN